MSGKNRQPAIRFAGFEGDWVEKKISEIAPLQRGFDLPQKDMKNGIYPVVMSNGIGAYHSEFKVKSPCVATGRSGTIGNVHYIDCDFWPHNTALWVTNFNGNYPLYIYVMYQKMNLRNLGTGSGVPTLNRNDVHCEKTYIPKISEQTTIGNFFQKIDNSIALHKRKHQQTQQLKKAMLTKMFPRNGQTQPEIRLKGFSGDWVERCLGKLAQFYSGGTPNVAIKDYYGGNIPFIRSGEISSKKTELFLTEEGFQNSSAKMVASGDILYALYGATSGEVEIGKINGAINQAILAIIPNEGVDRKFIALWLRKNKQEIISTYLQGGQGNLSANLIKSLVVQLPKVTEQTAIGNFFKQFDDTLALQAKQIDTLEKLKKALLQKCFV